MNNKYVTYDTVTGSVTLHLPDEQKEYENELFAELFDAYAYESINNRVVENMNGYVVEWFRKRNIVLK